MSSSCSHQCTVRACTPKVDVGLHLVPALQYDAIRALSDDALHLVLIHRDEGRREIWERARRSTVSLSPLSRQQQRCQWVTDKSPCEFVTDQCSRALGTGQRQFSQIYSQKFVLTWVHTKPIFNNYVWKLQAQQCASCQWSITFFK